MKVAIASDHRGYRAKEQIKIFLQTARALGGGFRLRKVRPVATTPTMPCLGRKAARSGKLERGIFLCGTGIGMAIMANKVRAAFGRASVTMNSHGRKCRAATTTPTCFACRLISSATNRCAASWMCGFGHAPTTRAGGHDRRLRKIADYESNGHCS